MVKRAHLVMFAAGIICAFFAPAAHANGMQTFGFYAITDNQPGDADALAAPQLFVDVFNGENTVKFRFRNEGPVDSIITDIYFADGTLFAIGDIIDATTYDGFDPLTGHPDVDFEAPARPGALPGGTEIGFVETSFYASVDAENPSPQWGIHDGVGEWVQINFDLLPDSDLTVDDVIAAIYSRELQIGIHVQGLGVGGQYSESFVNVPEPATIALMGIGMGILRRRSRNRRSQRSSAPKV